MKYQLYLLHTGMLQEEYLQQQVFSMLDSLRKEKVLACKREAERLRQLAAGLLLQVGVLECGELSRWNIESYITALEQRSKALSLQLPIEAVYEFGKQEKPYWAENFLAELPFEKTYKYFNLSHSGEYVVLAIADVEIGVDIQKARPAKYMKNDYREFSRMEAYAKCTGLGLARVRDSYEELDGQMPGYILEKVGIEGSSVMENNSVIEDGAGIEEYALWVCLRE